MSLQFGFAFQPKVDADEVFVPSRDALMAYAAGEVSGDDIGLHGYYSCRIEHCPQCNARDDACYEFEAACEEFAEGRVAEWRE